MWVEPDLNMPDGEALARQLLYGKRYFWTSSAWTSRSAGIRTASATTPQLPQIYNKGRNPLLRFRPLRAGQPSAFRWKGPDGSGSPCATCPGLVLTSA